MTVYHFHLRTAHGLERDEIGLLCPNLEEAYLDACASIPRLAVDLIEEGHDPSACCFEICDGANQLLMEVPFLERIKRVQKPPRQEPLAISRETQALFDQLDLLRLSIRDEMAKMRANLAQAHEETASIQAQAKWHVP
jgi:hypothetical protein